MDRVETMSSLFLNSWQIRENQIFNTIAQIANTVTGGSKVKIREEDVKAVQGVIWESVEELNA